MSQSAFQNAMAQLEKAVKILGLEENIYAQLKAPQRSLKVYIPVKEGIQTLVEPGSPLSRG